MNALLTDLAKNHNEWIRIVKSFGEYDYHEDIVQEMYIRAYKYVKEDKVINKSFVWLMLRNIYLDTCRNQNKTERVASENYVFIAEEPEQQKHEAYKRLLEKIDEEMKSWHHYDRLLFELYRDSGLSLRGIAKGTKISLRSIFHTIKHCKERIAENVGDDYEDFKNKDYELI